ncbi:MAG: gliding motility-associated C-terminal domain-containing protein [Elusimicrobia bacterium]|nr:gliding motility-associated C-terminal domain-containing protein [Elusimicrobiota bacterium]
MKIKNNSIFLLFGIFLLLFIYAGCKKLYAGNFLTNWNFETGNTSVWAPTPDTLPSAAYGIEISTKYAGYYSLFISTALDITDNCGLYQNVTVVAGYRFNLAGWIWNNDSNDTHTGFGLKPGGGGFNGVSVDVSNSTNTASDSNQWQFLNMSTQIASGVTTIGVNAYIRPTTSITISYFDNVYFGYPTAPSNLIQLAGTTSLSTMQYTNSAVIITSFTQSGSVLGNLKFHLQVSSITSGINPDWSQLFVDFVSLSISEGTTGYHWPALTDNGTYWWRVWSEDINDVVGSTSTTLGVGGNARLWFDNTLPVSSVTFPVNGSTTNFLTTISGTASDNASINKVELKIQRLSDNNYWTGSAWGSATWLSASQNPGWSTWKYTGLNNTDLTNATSYWVVSRASDTAGNIESSTVGSSTFTFIDTISPAGISNLTALPGANEGQIKLTWTAPGDDGTVGGISNGQYEIKYTSVAIITNGNYGSPPNPFSTITISTNYATPLQEHTTTLYNLTGGTSYYFAIKLTDEADNNWSVWNSSKDAGGVNTKACTWAQVDFTPPSQITTLTATPGAKESEIVLQWTSTGDDGVVGTITNGKYWVKYSTSSAKTWNYAEYSIQWSTSTSPLVNQTRVMTGLIADISYYFWIRLADENIRWSDGPLTYQAQSQSQTDVTQPAQITDLSGSSGVNDGEVILSWTAPGDDDHSGTAKNYTIRYATYQITETNWSSQSVFTVANPPSPSSSQTSETFTIIGLVAGRTYWFAMKTQDEKSNTSSISNSCSASACDLAPSKPLSLVATVGNCKILLDWQDNNESDISGYNIYRSVKTGGPYTIVNSSVSTNSEYTDILTEIKEYFYVVTAVDLTNHESTYSNEVSTIPIIQYPQKPVGIKGNLTSTGSFTISWSSVTKNSDGTDCNDLLGYNIYSAKIIKGPWTKIASVDKNTTTYTDTQTNWALLYYIIRAINISSVESESSIIVDSFDDGNIVVLQLDEQLQPVVELNISKEAGKIFLKEENNYGEDIMITFERHQWDEKSNDLYVYEINAVKSSSNQKIDDFIFPEKIELTFYYKVTDNKIEKLDISTDSANGQLGIFRHNGVEWVNLGGNISPNQQKVTVKTKHLSIYKLAQVQRASSFGQIRTIPAKIFTPNGDTKWDVMEFYFENPEKLDIIGKIFDLTGAWVCDMNKGNTDDSLLWDGNYESGEKSPSGVYIWQIEANRKVFNGTVVLAR